MVGTREVIEVNRKILLTVLALGVVLLATPCIGMARAQVIFYGPVGLDFHGIPPAWWWSYYSSTPPILYPPEYDGGVGYASPASRPVLPPGPEVPLPPLPGNTEGYYVVMVYDTFTGTVTVYVPYDSGFSNGNPRLYMCDPVDFNLDGTVNGQDIALMQNAIKRFQMGTLDSYGIWRFDINHDGVIDKADLRIVQQFASQGIKVNPGHNGVPEARLPWIDITTGTVVIGGLNYVVGVTDHLSIFGVR